MATKNYTTRTASLRATIADVRVLDAKKLFIDGVNITDLIKNGQVNILDDRGTLANDELDIWSSNVSTDEDGNVIVREYPQKFEISIYDMTETQRSTLQSAVKVENNQVLGANDEHLMFFETNALTKGGDIMDSSRVFTYSSNLTSFNSDLSSLTDGSYMFEYCTNLTSFSGDLSSLTTGSSMFLNCSQLTSFRGDLSNLTYGNAMFSRTSLTSFNGDLSSLTTGSSMFDECTNLTTFNSDLSSLTGGSYMFYNTSLASFSGDLSSLVSGDSMFSCTSLTSFSGDLSSLTDGVNMFYDTKLDAPSLANIIHTLPTHETGGTIDIGIGCDDTEADQLLFAQECDCETWQELLDEFSAKNWTVTFQCNGRPTTTYNMRRGETLPIYAKLIEVIMPTDENERTPHYAYTSADGSKFYNINYFHSTNGSTEGYDVFSSLEEAISTYNVTPKN